MPKTLQGSMILSKGILFIASFAVLSVTNRALAESFQEKQVRQANQAVLDGGQRLIDMQNRQAYKPPKAQEGAYPNIAPLATVPNFDVAGYAALFQAAAEQEAEKAARREHWRALILKRFEVDKSPPFLAFMKQHCDQAALNRKYTIAGYTIVGVGLATMIGGLFGYMGTSDSSASSDQDTVMRQSRNRNTILLSTLGIGTALSIAGLFLKPALGKEAYLHSEDCY